MQSRNQMTPSFKPKFLTCAGFVSHTYHVQPVKLEHATPDDWLLLVNLFLGGRGKFFPLSPRTPLVEGHVTI